MDGQGIVDLEELILRCRDNHARRYIQEAVASYRAGAYRAAIVTTWVAVVFDYIHKIRILALTGDKAAAQQVERLDKIRAKGKGGLTEALTFEREVLEHAEKLELLTSVEHADLLRLYEDRNRCAHPTMLSEDEPFNPTAELARANLRSAVDILLSREPVQGQAAFDRICAEVGSNYFPEDSAGARERLQAGPLGRAKRSLVRSVLIGFTKGCLNEDLGVPDRRRVLAAVAAVSDMYPSLAQEVLSSELPHLVAALRDDRWVHVVSYVRGVTVAWSAVGEAARHKMRTLTAQISGPLLGDVLADAMYIAELQPIASARAPSLDPTDFERLVAAAPRPEYVARGLEYFASVRGFRAAENRAASVLLPLSPFFSAADAKAAVRMIAENDQVWYAAEMPRMVEQLFDKTAEHLTETASAWQAFLQARIAAENGKLEEHFAYPGLRRRMEARGIWPPTP